MDRYGRQDVAGGLVGSTNTPLRSDRPFFFSYLLFPSSLTRAAKETSASETQALEKAHGAPHAPIEWELAPRWRLRSMQLDDSGQASLRQAPSQWRWIRSADQWKPSEH